MKRKTKMNFAYGESKVEFEIEYRDRKSLRISIEPPGHVFIIAPINMREEDIQKVLDKKSGWISRKLKEIKESGVLKSGKDYVDGEVFMYMGRENKLSIEMDNSLKKPIAEFNGREFQIRTNTRESSKLKKAMEDWYRKRTLEIVTLRIGHYQKHFHQRPLDIRSKRQKSRWGSCSSAHRLNFNLKCSMAPLEVVDYIVVHEMCHMVHFNHSKEFWSLLEGILPGYKERRTWLKNNGIRMNL